VAVLRLSAHIYLRASDEGGRQGYVASGYRPLLRFGDLYTDGAISLIDRERALPGESLDVHIDLPQPEYVAEHVRIGARFAISEGTHEVGEGTIIDLPENYQT
jgi:translation elongation factor EF-Tu-like GTPase